jgi:hypothetical protein
MTGAHVEMIEGPTYLVEPFAPTPPVHLGPCAMAAASTRASRVSVALSTIPSLQAYHSGAGDAGGTPFGDAGLEGGGSGDGPPPVRERLGGYLLALCAGEPLQLTPASAVGAAAPSQDEDGVSGVSGAAGAAVAASAAAPAASVGGKGEGEPAGAAPAAVHELAAWLVDVRKRAPGAVASMRPPDLVQEIVEAGVSVGVADEKVG